MSISVTVLGSAAMYATAERACSGYLLEYGDARVWMDAGGGTWRNLIQHIDHGEVTAMLLSHRHPDHVIDFFQAFHARMYGGPTPMPSIPVWAPEETIERLLAFYTADLYTTFDLKPVAGGDSIDIGGAKVSFTQMAHPPETLGMRFEYDGAVFAYSADTGPAADFDALAGAADLFICEATFQEDDEEWDGHMTAMQAGAAGLDAGVRSLVLTHLPDHRDLGITIAEAQKTCGDVEVRLAADGLRLEVERA
jgi:ribonuclease BN (tRNA processing enzyme)